MPSNISCPGCGHQGRLPDDLPAGAVLACHVCRVKFPAEPLVPPPPPADPLGLGVWVGDAITTTPMPRPPAPAEPTPAPPSPPVVTPQNAAAHLEWVRAEVEQFDAYVARQLELFKRMREQLSAFDSKARGEAIVRQQALDRDRAVLDARAKELDAQEARISAALKLQAAELHAELERQVAAEREHLARRAEALARGERALERRAFELDEMERGVRRELESAAGRFGTHEPTPVYDTTAPAD